MSNELKATKAPWEISWNTFNGGESHGVYAFGELDLKGHQIAIVNFWPTLDKEADEETGKANLQLIAAAPDLYNALKEYIESINIICEDLEDGPRKNMYLSIRNSPHYKKCIVALKKANPDYKP